MNPYLEHMAAALGRRPRFPGQCAGRVRPRRATRRSGIGHAAAVCGARLWRGLALPAPPGTSAVLARRGATAGDFESLQSCRQRSSSSTLQPGAAASCRCRSAPGFLDGGSATTRATLRPAREQTRPARLGALNWLAGLGLRRRSRCFPRELRHGLHCGLSNYVGRRCAVPAPRRRAPMAKQMPCRARASRPTAAACLARGLATASSSSMETTAPTNSFSLAHELAHFLRHYRQPRELAGRHFGAGTVAVFDGLRPPTAWERVHSLIDVPLGLHLHLMERRPSRQVRTEDRGPGGSRSRPARVRTPRPAAEVASRFAVGVGDEGRQRLAGLLQSDFGFPPEQANDYARLPAPPISDEALLRACAVDGLLEPMPIFANLLSNFFGLAGSITGGTNDGTGETSERGGHSGHRCQPAGQPRDQYVPRYLWRGIAADS